MLHWSSDGCSLVLEAVMTFLRLMLAGIGVFCLQLTIHLAAAEDSKSHTIISSTEYRAVFSTKDMHAGSEIFYAWLMLPPGEKVEVKKSEIGDWLHYSVVLGGTATFTGGLAQACEVVHPKTPSQQSSGDIIVSTGDSIACNYALGGWLAGAPRVENRGNDPFILATVDVGGPWTWAMHTASTEYDKHDGWVKLMSVQPDKFKNAEQEILKLGALVTNISRVNMPAGSRVVMVDRYPTFRMILDGEWQWGTLPPGTDPSLTPKMMFKQKTFGQSIWGLLPNDIQFVMTNNTNRPLQYLQWSVTPLKQASQ
jgi:hypothetical protein